MDVEARGSDKLVNHVRKVLAFVLAGVPEPTLAAAVSGGVDSMVLLHILRQISQTGLFRLHALHVNHGLRKAASADELFFEQVCQSWGIAAHSMRIRMEDVQRSERKGTEADARSLRYDALYQAADKIGAKYIALGHHADDQLETILWRLLRGTSVTGLGGIRQVTHLAAFYLIRPLLEITREEILDYARENCIPHVEDESNASDVYVRNYLRHEIVPRLREIQPNVAKTVGHTARLVQEDDEFLDEQASLLFRGAAAKINGQYRIALAEFREHARPLQRRVIKIILYCLTSANWTSVHVDEVMRLTESQRPSARVQLQNGISAWREYAFLMVGRASPTVVSPSHQIHWTLSDGASADFPSDTDAGCWHFLCRRWKPEDGVRSPNLLELRLPLVPEVVIRTVKTSERVALIAVKGSKKIQDVFTDAKVLRSLRATWPAVVYDGSVVWLPGLIRSRDALIAATCTEGWSITAVKYPEGAPN